ncbi:MAG TPA: F0F1 ATP synthase subunit epsilon [Thermoanaerobaculia bacterium]|nr:F0F1 ATP synthase subunit epsilon [Thermoanaerobaculia bacterium]
MTPAPGEGKLHLVLVDHDRQLLDVEADEVQVPGSEGVLGILPGHTPLIATLKVGEVMYRQGKIEHYLALSEGFVEVADDVVTVLTESAELPEEIDVEAAREEATEAEAALLAAEDVDWMQAQARLEKAMARIHVAETVRLRDVRPRE